jgi:hypothetical protein
MLDRIRFGGNRGPEGGAKRHLGKVADCSPKVKEDLGTAEEAGQKEGDECIRRGRQFPWCCDRTKGEASPL